MGSSSECGASNCLGFRVHEPHAAMDTLALPQLPLSHSPLPEALRFAKALRTRPGITIIQRCTRVHVCVADGMKAMTT